MDYSLHVGYNSGQIAKREKTQKEFPSRNADACDSESVTSPNLCSKDERHDVQAHAYHLSFSHAKLSELNDTCPVFLPLREKEDDESNEEKGQKEGTLGTGTTGRATEH